MALHENILDTIGGTPLVRLAHVVPNGSSVLAKIEWLNPLLSVKDRAASAMVLDAEERGALVPGSTIVEPTSGNTGIALAWIGAARGYRVVLVMPESMSVERRDQLKALGAELVLTPAKLGMSGAIDRVREIVTETDGAIHLDQFGNPANPEIHRRTTAEEIWADTGGAVDVFVAGVGTGGTITGVGEVLKERRPSVRVVAVEPATSAVMSGGGSGPHGIQGIGAGFVPANLNLDIIDEIVTVADSDAFAMARRLLHEEGIFAGLSAGAAVHAAAFVAARREHASSVVVTILPDSGVRYISTGVFG